MRQLIEKLEKSMMVIASLLALFPLCYADGSAAGVYLKGATETPAGDYVVLETEEVFYYNGNAYDVYLVQYENIINDLKIAVHTGDVQ